MIYLNNTHSGFIIQILFFVYTLQSHKSAFSYIIFQFFQADSLIMSKEDLLQLAA